jgi:two-component system phosphate regulon response regulator OmpR
MPEAAPEGARILVVEDQPKLRQLLHAVLTRAQHSVDAVPSAEEARRYLAATEYDVIISDDGALGHPPFGAVRSSQPGAGLVLIASWDSDLTLPPGAPGSIDAVVRKPFSATDIRQVVERVVAQRRRSMRRARRGGVGHR